MPDVLTIRDAVQRAKNENIPISEYSLRMWVRTGAIPTRKIGKKALLFYPNVVRYIQCEGDCDNPADSATSPGTRRINAG